MAENQGHAKPNEREIPVFTVLKNSCILKNIFLLDNPPSISSSPSSTSVSKNRDQESVIEEILVVGRHPDCNIKLEHPSISRFHLRIHSNPAFRSLYVTDLSSVHGTWISGKRIEPGVRMILNEGDVLRLGASSRLYRLNWIPISRAYDIDNPFVPQLDATDTVDEETDEAIVQDQVESLSDDLEGLERLFSDEDFGSSLQKTNILFSDKEEVENEKSPGMYSHENELFITQPCQLEKENGIPSEHLLETSEISGMNSEKKSGPSIWLRRGKPRSVQIETSGCKRNFPRINMSSQVNSFIDENHKSGSILKDLDNEEENLTPSKELFSPGSLISKSPKRKSEENFTPDKENMIPNNHLLRSMKNIVVKSPNSSHKSSPLKTAYYSKMYQEENVFCALEASERRTALQELKSTDSASKRHGSSKKKPAILEARANRDPFCPLPVNSPSDHTSNSKKPSVGEDAMRGSRSIKYPESQEVNCSNNNTAKVAENRWIIVVDTACMLNKKSRNELQLLRGLQGTTLVIPRIVVRELDCMSRRGNLFTRSDISAALQYIEESMAVAKWWIHVQSSAEEGRLTPPTPPASSTHWLGEDMWTSSIGSSPFSPCSLQEIVTPTAADHILEYALYCKRIRKDGRLVLLTDDVTLKIKAMAEGVLCETAQEFRRSLVNPFSTRFLYSNCSPIGPTWSCADDAVLKEKYYPSPSKKMSKSGEGAKGLKLILMHNSSFRHQIKPVS